MLAAAACLALSHKADRADQSPALVPLNERVSSVDGIDRLHAWLSAKKKLNEEGVRLQGGHSKPAAKPQRNRTVASSHTASGRSKAKRNTSLVAAQPRRSLEEARKAIADAQRGTQSGRTIMSITPTVESSLRFCACASDWLTLTLTLTMTLILRS